MRRMRVDKHPVFLTSVRIHGGWAHNQPAAMGANLRWQSGNWGKEKNSLIPAQAGTSCNKSHPSLPEVPASAGMSEQMETFRYPHLTQRGRKKRSHLVFDGISSTIRNFVFVRFRTALQCSVLKFAMVCLLL